MSIRQWITNRRSRRLILALILALVVAQFVRGNVGTFSVVDGVSMCPTFQPNDVVQARTLSAEAQRGDVVILADDRGDRMIKRIIGLPGETVTVYRGFVYINHQRLNEPYLPKYTYTFKSNERNERADVWQLGDQEYFVLGDNRLQSTDSRHYGPVTRGRIDRIVSTPANTARPGFCELMLSETGKVVPGKYGHHPPGRNRSRDPLPVSNARI